MLGMVGIEADDARKVAQTVTDPVAIAGTTVTLTLTPGVVSTDTVTVAYDPTQAGANDFALHYLSSRLLLEGQSPYGVPIQPMFDDCQWPRESAIV